MIKIGRIKMEEVGLMQLSVTTWGYSPDMAESKGFSESRRKALARWLPGIAEVAVDKLGASRIETLELMTDVEQVGTLFASLDDLRQGRIVNMQDAFGDL